MKININNRVWFASILIALFLIVSIFNCKARQSVDSLYVQLESDSLFSLLNKNPENAEAIVQNLLKRAERSSNKKRIQIYKEIGEHYYSSEMLDLAEDFFIRGNRIASDAGSNYYSAFFKLRLGIIQNTRANYQEALDHLYYAKEIVLETDSFKLESDIFRNAGNVYWGMGIYDKALENYLISLETANKHNLNHNIASATNNIGNVYQAVHDYHNARNYYQRAYAIAKKYHYKWIAAIASNNIGDLLNIQKKPDSSIYYFTLSYNILEDLDSKFYKGVILFNIGDIYLQIDSIKLSRQYFKESLELAKASYDKLGIVNCYLKIGESFLLENRFEEAGEYINIGTNNAKETGSFNLLELAYRLKADYYHKKGMIDSAFAYQSRQISVKDSIASQESGEAIARLENRYKEEKSRLEIEALKKDKVNSRRMFLVVVIAISIILIIIIISLRNSRKRSLILIEKNKKIQAQQQMLQERNAELTQSQEELKRINDAKDQFLTILSHDLKNPVSAIRGFVELMINNYKQISEEKKKIFLQEIFNSIETVSLLVTNVLFWVRSQTRGIKNQPELIDLSKRIDTNISLYNLIAKDKEIILDNNIPDDIQIYADMNILDTIVRNLLSNSLKFTNKGGKISFSATNHSNQVTLEIKDTGIGISPEKIQQIKESPAKYSSAGTRKEQGTGLGLELIQDFILLLGGDLTINSTLGKGTSFQLVFPVPRKN